MPDRPEYQCEPDDIVWLRDLDGTGSMHVCTPYDDGALIYVRQGAGDVAAYLITDGQLQAERALNAELLEALAGLGLQSEDWRVGFTGERELHIRVSEADVLRARAAIAKARGEQ